MKTLLLALISFYRRCISPAFPARCRFRPTCSVYAESRRHIAAPTSLGLISEAVFGL